MHLPLAGAQTPISCPERNRPGHRAGQLWDQVNARGALGAGGGWLPARSQRGCHGALQQSLEAHPRGWRRFGLLRLGEAQGMEAWEQPGTPRQGAELSRGPGTRMWWDGRVLRGTAAQRRCCCPLTTRRLFYPSRFSESPSK